jgi:O-antigen/teichoic acid export membrane protein
MPAGEERPNQTGEDTIVSGAVAAWTVQLGVYALGFVTSVLIARALGPSGRGEYYLPVTAGLTAMTIMHVSLESANTFFFAERRLSLSRLAGNAGALALALGPVGVGLLFAFYALTRNSVFTGVEPSEFAIAAAVLPFQLHLLWLGGILQLGKRLSRAQKALGAGAVVQLVLVGGLYAADELTVTAVLIAYAASIAVPWAIQLWLARGVVRVGPLFDWTLTRPILAFALKLHVGMVFWFLLLRADVFLVGYYLDSAAVGVYSLAVIFAELGLTLTAPLAMAALPYQSEAELGPAANLSFRVARVNALIALGLAVAFTATLWLAIPLLYGSEFEDAYPALVLLVPGIVALALARPLGSWLVRQDRPWTMASLAFGAFAMNLALNAVLVPDIGINGASLASTISYVVFAGGFALWALRASGLSMREGLMPRRSDVRRSGRPPQT